MVVVAYVYVDLFESDIRIYKRLNESYMLADTRTKEKRNDEPQ